MRYNIIVQNTDHMKTLQDASGKRSIVFLSQDDLEILIYMSSDVWITPELKRFKNDLLEKAQARSFRADSGGRL